MGNFVKGKQFNPFDLSGNFAWKLFLKERKYKFYLKTNQGQAPVLLISLPWHLWKNLNFKKYVHLQIKYTSWYFL